MWGNTIAWIVISGKKTGAKIDSEWTNAETDLSHTKIRPKTVQYPASLIPGLNYKKFAP